MIFDEYELWCAERRAKKIAKGLKDYYLPRLEAARKENNQLEYQNLLSEFQFELEGNDEPRRLRTEHLVKRARKLGILIPPQPDPSSQDADENEYWDINRTTWNFYLTPKAESELWREVYRIGQERHQYRTRWANLLMVLFTGILAIGSVVFYFYYVPKEWKAMDESVSIARQSLEVVERAWVGITHMRLTSGLMPGRKLEVEVGFHNTGRTPARQVEVVYQFIWASEKRLHKIPPFEHDPNVNLSISALSPGATYLSHPSSKALAPQLAAKIKSGDLLVYVYEAIKYLDTFGHWRRTEVCAVFNPELEKFDPCDHHNSMD